MMFAGAHRTRGGRVGTAAVCVGLAWALASGCETRKVIKARPVSPQGWIAVSAPTDIQNDLKTADVETPTCGSAGLPECPLQYWMDHHLSGPLSREDFPTLARSFRDLAAAEPPGFSGWRLWADGGAMAAQQEDDAGVRRACTGCHNTYRERYRQTLRERPMPGADPP